MPKIVDGFIFGLEYELDLLELRLEYLDKIVDHFVLVEATFTHLGEPKEAYFDLNKSRFSKWLDKIVHIILHEPVNQIPGSWDNEFYHRNQLTQGFKQLNLDSDDIVIMSDLDEFPNIDALQYYRDNDLRGTYGLVQSLHYYYLNLRAAITWDGSQVSRWQQYIGGITPQQLRDNRISSTKIPKSGGWHFSYMGGIPSIAKKLNGITESGQVRSWIDNPKLMQDAITNKKIFFNDNELIEDVINADNYPQNIINRLSELTQKGYIYVSGN